MSTMTFQVTADRTDVRPLSVDVDRVLIAGFTGRDSAQVKSHMDELASIGVPLPESVPSVVETDPSSLVMGDRIAVGGTFTSGEVEPVIVLAEGRRYLGVGSDHTDREVEKRSIAQSKRACPKVVGDTLLPLDLVEDADEIRLMSWVDGEQRPYQSGTMGQLLRIDEIEASLDSEGYQVRDGDVVYLGTIPVIGPLRPSGSFRGRLDDPASSTVLELAYHVAIDRSRKDGA